MADPVSWLLIEPGWRVESSDGAEVGRVEEVTGDSGADIFDGLAIAFSALGRQHYVPAEQVAEITQGRVRLRLDEASVKKLSEFDEPAEEVEISPEKASPLARFETHELHPATRAHRTGIVRRVVEWFGRTGRR
jgi:hypothetical protein